jgi:hypothetical protein
MYKMSGNDAKLTLTPYVQNIMTWMYDTVPAEKQYLLQGDQLSLSGTPPLMDFVQHASTVKPEQNFNANVAAATIADASTLPNQALVSNAEINLIQINLDILGGLSERLFAKYLKPQAPTLIVNSPPTPITSVRPCNGQTPDAKPRDSFAATCCASALKKFYAELPSLDGYEMPIAVLASINRVLLEHLMATQPPELMITFCYNPAFNGLTPTKKCHLYLLVLRQLFCKVHEDSHFSNKAFATRHGIPLLALNYAEIIMWNSFKLNLRMTEDPLEALRSEIQWYAEDLGLAPGCGGNPLRALALAYGSGNQPRLHQRKRELLLV